MGDDGAMLIELRQVTKRFAGVVANESVNLGIRAGEVHVLVGENGAGKSTVAGLLTGLLQPDSGDVVVDGLLGVLADRGVSAGIDRLVEAPTGRPSIGSAACYARVLVDDRPVWGVGLAATTAGARGQAVRSALHRSGALVETGDGRAAAMPHPVGSRVGTR